MLQNVAHFNENIADLQDYCFKNCTEMTEVRLSPQIKRIGAHCFDSCNALTAVTYDAFESSPDDKTKPLLSCVGDSAFKNCPQMKSVTFPESINKVDMLDKNALAGSSLTCVTFMGITSETLLGG